MKTKTQLHKLTAWLLTLAMLMTFIPSFTLTASAATEVYAHCVSSILGIVVPVLSSLLQPPQYVSPV